ncbi:glycosyl hydrolase 108 family protein [Xanthobacter sp. V7C-4]|uniref:glycoside hydrolase family 108 protein n=1 Tax=Xanthobacter autotrophicus (strain ATCC BAA-1158 / Py2) TaxID=78245 RepID=UPI0037284BE5
MAKTSFAPALTAVLRHEGGYSNHPDDPGGPTMKGIIQRVYDGYRRGKGLAVRPVREIEEEELQEIYRRQYWDAIRADELPEGIDYVVFDGAVNSGPGQSVKWLQRALGLPADAEMGAVTLAAARAAAETAPARLVDDICDRRLAMLKALRTWPVFGRGWGRRVEDVRKAGKAWVAGSAPARRIPVLEGHRTAAQGGASGKAPVASARAAPKPQAGAGAAAGGIAASAVSEAARQIAPHAQASSTLALVFTGLTLLGLALTLGGIAYVWWSARAGARRAAILDLLPAGPAS